MIKKNIILYIFFVSSVYIASSLAQDVVCEHMLSHKQHGIAATLPISVCRLQDKLEWTGSVFPRSYYFKIGDTLYKPGQWIEKLNPGEKIMIVPIPGTSEEAHERIYALADQKDLNNLADHITNFIDDIYNCARGRTTLFPKEDAYAERDELISFYQKSAQAKQFESPTAHPECRLLQKKPQSNGLVRAANGTEQFIDSIQQRIQKLTGIKKNVDQALFDSSKQAIILEVFIDLYERLLHVCKNIEV